MTKKLYIVPFQHNDLVWRRCFERDAEFAGQSFIPYADIEEFYIKSSVELCEKYPEYKFQIECVAVLEKFLEGNPEYKDKLQQLLDEDRIYIPFTGYCITDSNLIDGESMIRSYLYGWRYLRDNFSYTPEIIDRLDSFGNSGQVPQIARGFGEKAIVNLQYGPNRPDKDYFRGIDGSTVFAYTPIRVGMAGGGVPKYRPCPACNGYRDTDCPVCGNKRIDEHYLNTYGGIVETPMIDTEKLESSDIPCYIHSGGEEIIPNDTIIKWAKENSDKYDIAFGYLKDMLPYYQDKIDAVDNADEKDIYAKPELNCSQTGCYVTRIKVKQGVRRMESAMNTAEVAAVMSYINSGKTDKQTLNNMWRDSFFSMFHDSVTGTIIDDGYTEIMDKIADAENAAKAITENALAAFTSKDNSKITVLNTNGSEMSAMAKIKQSENGNTVLLNGERVPQYVSDGEIHFFVEKLAPFSQREYTLADGEIAQPETTAFTYKAGVITDAVLGGSSETTSQRAEDYTACIENDFYKITTDAHGITEIFAKDLNKVVAEKGESYIGEWILEHDEGSPWATMSPDMHRNSFARFTKLVSIERAADYEKITFQIEPEHLAGFAIHGIEVFYSVRLVKNSKMIYFTAEVPRWDEQSQRLRIAFPTESNGRHIYEIPYGTIERKPYKPDIVRANGTINWESAAGDYPAHNWAGVEGETTTAVFNKGIPSYQINTDSCGKQTIYITPLRSPSIGAFLHSPREYVMTAYDGMRDAGEHSFEYALSFYADGFDKNTAVADGIAFNTEPTVFLGTARLPQLPTVNADGVRVSSIKVAENGDGIIVRLVEYHGNAETVTVTVPEYAKSAFTTDLKEDIISPADILNGAVTLTFRPYEIKTLLIKQ